MSTLLPLHPERQPEFRLTGTRVAEYFRFACERQLRLELAGARASGIERAVRPGAGLLKAAGAAWERRKVLQLVARLGERRVALAGFGKGGRAETLAADAVVAILRDPGEVELLVQPELRLLDPERFARRHGLDPRSLRIASAIPDLIRVRRLRSGERLLQIVDIKASATARIPHYAQIAYYSLLLDEIRESAGIEARVDHRWGRVWCRDGRGPARFALAAYRHHVAEVLRRDLPRVLESDSAACAWHLSTRCAGCAYLPHCRAEAEAGDDLARVAGITPVGKSVLHSRGFRTARELALKGKPSSYEGAHALESNAERLGKRAHAITYGKIFPIKGRTQLMPADEDVRLVLTAEGDPVSNRVFALGMRVEGRAVPREAPRLGVWISEGGTARAERAILQGLLASLERVLLAASLPSTGARRGGASVHFYVYDRGELDLLRELLLRHLPDARSRPAIARLLRVLSPREVTLQPDVVRSAPGTVVADAVAALFALPVPYTYDLPGVSDRLRPASAPAVWRPRSDYSWPFSSQVAFERIHNVWRGRPHSAGGESQAPEAVREEIQANVVAKLAAIDSVIRALREKSAREERLQLRKEPFALLSEETPLADPDLDALRIFTELESAAEAAALQALHLRPSVERARRFECIRGLDLVERREDGNLVFDFDPSCRDSKFRPGEFNLVLTPDDDVTLIELDRQPWKRRALTVELVGFELDGPAPRVVLAPGSGLAKAEAQRWIDLDGDICALDRAPSDFSTARVLASLAALDSGGAETAPIVQLLRGETPAGWPSPLGSAEETFRALLAPLGASRGAPVLNADQEAAWRAAFDRPLSLVWGPPGTGKTYLLAWMLVGLAVAARRAGRPFRVLVCAATHRAVANVLARLAKEREGAALDLPLRAVKLRGSGSESDGELEGAGVEVVDDSALPALLAAADAGGEALIVGSTVWSLWKRMRSAGGAGEEEGGRSDRPVASWFDLVVIDEASQMKVAESLIALSSARAGARVILCGDDRQLAPVLRGRYGKDAGTLFGSAFGHFASHTRPAVLRESRRMNEALARYPRRLFYPGLVSMRPDYRVAVAPAALSPADALIRDLFLDPRDAVVLCTYRGARSTARNRFEAGLAATIARLARALLLDPSTGARHDDESFVGEAMAIISPHRAQNSAILGELRAAGLAPSELPVVDTVERMQGNERDLILVSYAVADREYAESEAEFLLDPNRFNVAVTRARAKLILLVSEETLRAVPSDERVMEGSMALKGYVAHCRHRVVEVALPGPDGTVEARIHYRTLGD